MGRDENLRERKDQFVVALREISWRRNDVNPLPPLLEPNLRHQSLNIAEIGIEGRTRNSRRGYECRHRKSVDTDGRNVLEREIDDGVASRLRTN